jgi:hypothetical protein
MHSQVQNSNQTHTITSHNSKSHHRRTKTTYTHELKKILCGETHNGLFKRNQEAEKLIINLDKSTYANATPIKATYDFEVSKVFKDNKENVSINPYQNKNLKWKNVSLNHQNLGV